MYETTLVALELMLLPDDIVVRDMRCSRSSTVLVSCRYVDALMC